MKFAHISDLHLNTYNNDLSYQRVNQLLKHLSKIGIDHLIITGDLTENGQEKEFVIIRRLLKRYGFLSGDKLSLVIGNHDIFGGVLAAEDILNFPAKCAETNYNSKITDFISYFPESFENCSFISQKGFFPFVKILQDVQIIGMNSIAQYSKLKNSFASNGKISNSQFVLSTNLLRNYTNIKYKIVLVHHHFHKTKTNAKSSLGTVWQNIEKQTIRLKNKRRLFNLFKRENVSLVLHGHVHQMKEYQRKGIRFINAGGSVKNQNKSIIQSYLLDFNGTGIETELLKFDFAVKRSPLLKN